MSEEEGLLGGRYRLFEVLGSGGMATVWRAQDTVLDRPVAVKVLRPDLAADPGFVTRFRREARHAASLDHPCLVTVFDSGVDNGAVFIVMELVVGRTLRTYLDESGPLAPDEAVRIAAAICEGLGVAHSAGIVHRDIKPANVLLSPGGGVKILDFGIARADGSESLTMTGNVLGTVAYLAPEQARGEQVGPAADVYALGCVLFELLTGEPPFRADTAVALAFRQMNDTPPSPGALRRGLPPALDALVLAMLAKNPADRPGPASSLRAALLDAQAAWAGPTAATMRLPGAATPTAAKSTAAKSTAAKSVAARFEGARSRRWRVLLAAVAAAAVIALVGLGLALGDGHGPKANASTHRTTTTTSSTSTTSTTTTTVPLTPQTALDALRATIGTQAASGAIDAHAETQLLQRVDSAQAALDSGSAQGAQGPISDLEHQLTDLQNQGDINSSAASAIDQGAQAVLSTLLSASSAGTGGGPAPQPGKGGKGGQDGQAGG